MARKRRLESSDSIYHVINRGNYRRFVFGSDGAKHSFEQALFEACERSGWELFAYSILSNHYHLCVGTPKGNLSEGMRWLQATFANRYNRLRKESGHLFQGRFKSLLVEPGEAWVSLVNYIHLNALRAGLEKSASLGSYRWSSLNRFPKRGSRPACARVSWMNYLAEIEDAPGGWTRYRNLLRLRAAVDRQEMERLERQMTRGWCIGSGAFKRAVLEEVKDSEGAARFDHDELQELNRLRWEQCLAKGLRVLRKSESDAAGAKRSETWKLALASKLKRETSVTNLWLSEKLHMGAARGVSSNCTIYRRDREARCKHAKRLRNFTFAY